MMPNSFSFGYLSSALLWR